MDQAAEETTSARPARGRGKPSGKKGKTGKPAGGKTPGTRMSLRPSRGGAGFYASGDSDSEDEDDDAGDKLKKGREEAPASRARAGSSGVGQTVTSATPSGVNMADVPKCAPDLRGSRLLEVAGEEEDEDEDESEAEAEERAQRGLRRRRGLEAMGDKEGVDAEKATLEREEWLGMVDDMLAVCNEAARRITLKKNPIAHEYVREHPSPRRPNAAPPPQLGPPPTHPTTPTTQVRQATLAAVPSGPL